MIDNTKIEAMIAHEMNVIEVLLTDTQDMLDICADAGAVLDGFQKMQECISERVAAFPAAVMAHGPFKTVGDARAALEMEVKFVVAAFDGGS